MKQYVMQCPTIERAIQFRLVMQREWPDKIRDVVLYLMDYPSEEVAMHFKSPLTKEFIYDRLLGMDDPLLMRKTLDCSDIN